MGLGFKLDGNDGTALVMLHFLGGSGREWDEVDTPSSGPQVRTTMTRRPPGLRRLRRARPATPSPKWPTQSPPPSPTAGLDRYVLVGHSMGGKVAMVLARRAQLPPRVPKMQRSPASCLLAPSPPAAPSR